MDLSLKYQPTPNPNALIFHCPEELSRGGPVQLQKDTPAPPPLAEALFALEGVESLLLDGKRLTLSKRSERPWGDLLPEADKVLRKVLPDHQPQEAGAGEDPEIDAAELQKISSLIDAHIRPFLQNDGGDLSLLGLKGKVLSIRYLGACGSCPAAFGGTLQAIRKVLQEHYREDIQVIPV